ncbi:hypothetical protein COCC4DRAFT_148745 [Bipolaris maydis ATCC 48331]|uniref:Uncharacterized protein n=2 Tax=Cochliobolus heterostrophus TaxID=5016 RepID=M2V3C5_COCH5|nr:uncharacterized protein COCC4DRAFT_148745 [Bipolaris maydis ATCC 48331]EMD94502.1 hypothetical protein COCHEDRAFT_1153779 [Bipolaris maydis C5]ENI01155.1 hypothetical protein COCC4DRAFT_148745 [Bipolaris maydis ATCC 48331]KAJ6209916.1 hypothetical protein PSV09DRAFT_1153779 [Bipolaris maydis]
MQEQTCRPHVPTIDPGCGGPTCHVVAGSGRRSEHRRCSCNIRRFQAPFAALALRLVGSGEAQQTRADAQECSFRFGLAMGIFLCLDFRPEGPRPDSPALAMDGMHVPHLARRFPPPPSLSSLFACNAATRLASPASSTSQAFQVAQYTHVLALATINKFEICLRTPRRLLPSAAGSPISRGLPWPDSCLTELPMHGSPCLSPSQPQQ